MPLWKRNLIVCWIGMFITGIGISQVAPILPLFVEELGVNDPSRIAMVSGIAFGVTFIVAAIFSPIWGKAADKYGRKPMLLRASLGMAIIIFLTGFSPNVYVLIIMRTLQGVIAGYATACTTLIATQTDREHAGYALGTLSTASIAGSLIGPLLGGYLGETLGYRNVFFVIGGLMMITFITTALFVKEDFVRSEEKVPNIKEAWQMVPEKSITITLFVTFFIINFSLFSIEPIITLYIDQLAPVTTHLALLSGLAFSAAGLANIIAAPRLGKLSDRIGAHKVIFVALIAAALTFIPQSFVTAVWQLVLLRFILGLTIGGLNPSVNTLIKRVTPQAMTGRVFGFNMSAGYIGVFCGSVIGGQIAGHFGIETVFLFTGTLLLLNAIWAYFKVYKVIGIKKFAD